MSVVRAVAVGGAAGYGASQAMDRVTTAFLERQSQSSRERERQLSQEMATAVLVKKIGEIVDRKIDEEQATRVGSWIHYGLGVGTGVAAALLVDRGMGAMAAGLTSALGTWLLVDEGAIYVLGLTPPATEYPLVTHVRGLVGHLALGLVLGSLLGLSRRLLRGR